MSPESAEYFFSLLRELDLLDKNTTPLEALILSAPIMGDDVVWRRRHAGRLDTLEVLSQMTAAEKKALKARVAASGAWAVIRGGGDENAAGEEKL